MTDNTINSRTPEEIKELLECCYGDTKRRLCEKCSNVINVEGYSELMCKDFDAVGQSALALIQQLESAQPKWISVEDRLPERFKDVLVFSRNGSVTWTEVAHLTRNQWWRVGIPMINVTHWMPLPEPPKEEE